MSLFKHFSQSLFAFTDYEIDKNRLPDLNFKKKKKKKKKLSMKRGIVSRVA